MLSFSDLMSKKRLPLVNPYLPEEIQIQILSKSLVKSLMRFRCVSKRWYSIISDQKFVQLHLAQSDVSSNRENVLVVPTDITGEDSSNKDLNYVGTCNGLVCFSINNEELVVFNPSIGCYRELPFPQQIHEDDSCAWGFGYDSSRDDFKIILCLERFPDYNNCMVFSFKDEIWRSPLESVRSDMINLHCLETAVFLNGCLYWNTFRPVILCFDLSTEVFKEIPEPDHCIPACEYSRSSPGFSPTGPGIGALGSHLWASRMDWYGFGHQHNIWVLKEYNDVKASWVKLLNLPTSSPCRELFPLFFLRNGEVLVAFDYEGFLGFVACHLLEDRQEKINGLPMFRCETGMIKYTESLVKPNCGKKWKGNPLFRNSMVENVTYFPGDRLRLPSTTMQSAEKVKMLHGESSSPGIRTRQLANGGSIFVTSKIIKLY